MDNNLAVAVRSREEIVRRRFEQEQFCETPGSINFPDIVSLRFAQPVFLLSELCSFSPKWRVFRIRYRIYWKK